MKECPFCGSQEIETSLYTGNKYYNSYAYCEGCGARGPSVNNFKEELERLTFELWNRRVKKK